MFANRFLSPPLINQIRHQAAPAGLVRGAESCAVFTVEVFVEEQQIAPVWIVLEFASRSVDRAAFGTALEKCNHATRYLFSHLFRLDRSAVGQIETVVGSNNRCRMRVSRSRSRIESTCTRLGMRGSA